MTRSLINRSLELLPTRLIRAVGGKKVKSAHNGNDGRGRPFHSSGARQLLVDVSVVTQLDARTGIQRVVRAWLAHLIDLAPAGFRIRPIYATRKQGYRYAPYPAGLPFHDDDLGKEVTVARGDVFLGLDLSSNVLPQCRWQLIRWRRQGVSCHYVVYDLLPVLRPEWFSHRGGEHYRAWLSSLAMTADGALCISEAVRQDLLAWLENRHGLTRDQIKTAAIPLGCDIDTSLPSSESAADTPLPFAENMPFLLMVGTLEPRKGHAHVLEAFNLLWSRDENLGLVIVGQPGWKTEDVQSALRTHPQSGKKLVWYDRATDTTLRRLYAACRGVVVASWGEGFGLPIVEAQAYGKPVLARDLPVFREVGGAWVTYFDATSNDGLADAIAAWVISSAVEKPVHASVTTWRQSTEKLLEALSRFDQQ